MRPAQWFAADFSAVGRAGSRLGIVGSLPLATVAGPDKTHFLRKQPYRDAAEGTDDVLLTDADGAVIMTDDGLPPVNLPQWEAVGISVLRADGMVADQSGNIAFNAHLPIGDVSEAMGGPGIVLPGTAEIHLVVRDYGPADPAILNDMLNTMNGGCEADFPNPPCVDVQVAVFQF